MSFTREVRVPLGDEEIIKNSDDLQLSLTEGEDEDDSEEEEDDVD